MEAPVLSTLILLFSGVTLTASHSFLLQRDKLRSFGFLVLTIFAGLIFLLLQLKEYSNLNFSINDGVYGSIFFFLTGFHGLHVTLGVVMLIWVSYDLWADNLNTSQHLIFEFSAWY